MKKVLLGLGSNIQPAHHLPLGLAALEFLLSDCRHSSVYESDAVGFVGDPFWNLAVEARTTLAVGELQALLRNIEFEHGREDNSPRFSPRALDIDILAVDEIVGTVDGIVLPRGEILHAAFVLRPLAELVPEATHPVLGDTYGDLWDAFDHASQPLQEVSLPRLKSQGLQALRARLKYNRFACRKQATRDE